MVSMVEKVARSIEPIAFDQFESLRDYCLRSGESDEEAQRTAEWAYGHNIKRAIEKARAAIEAISFPEITEDAFYEIEEAAAKRMREWERGYYCQDIRIQHSMAWWIAKEVEARMRAALYEEVKG